MFTAFVYPSGKLAQMSRADFAAEFPNIKRVIVRPIPEEPAMKKLFYFNAATIPAGIVTSTARKGDEWFNDVEVGDTVKVRQVHGDKRSFGISIVVAKELLPYEDVLANAQHNSVGYNKSAGAAMADLWDTLHRAYGSIDEGQQFSVLHLLPVNDLHGLVDDIAGDLMDAAKTLVQEVVDKSAGAIELANHSSKLLLDTVTHLQEQLDAALAPNEVAARNTIDHIVNVAAGAISAREHSHDVMGVTLQVEAGAVKEVVTVIMR